MSESGAGKGGRYNRTTNGLIGSMIVTVLAVIAFVVFRGVFSRDLEVEPDRVAYLESVAELQAEEVEVVYPAALPEGWTATNVGYTPGTGVDFRLSLLTDDGDFVGVRQEPGSADDLLDEYVYVDGATAVDEGTYEAAGSVAPSWASSTDDGGDHAYVAEVGDETVLVFGSAPAEQVEWVVDALTTAPVAAGAGG